MSIKSRRSPLDQLRSTTLANISISELVTATPCLTESAINDFFRQVSAAFPLRTTGRLPGTWIVVEPKAQEQIFSQSNQQGWSKFRTLYPNSNGIVTFSRVGFSSDGSQAFVYAGHQWDRLGGLGALYVLQKNRGLWKVLYSSTLWVS